MQSATSYSLTINPNGGSWSGSENEQVFTQTTGSTKDIVAPTRAGYKFTGWQAVNKVEDKISNLGKAVNTEAFFTNSVELTAFNGSTLTRVGGQSLSFSPYSSYITRIVNTGNNQGFYITRNGKSLDAYDNAEYITVFQAKIPKDAQLFLDGNWRYEKVLFSPATHGSDDWQTYVVYGKDAPNGMTYVTCDTNYIMLSSSATSANPLTWEIANLQVYEATGLGLDPDTVAENLSDKMTYTFGSGNQILVALWEEDNWLKYADTEWQGKGTEKEPYLISTAEELAGLSYQVRQGNFYQGKFFKQTANINLGGHEWMAIGKTVSTVFFGHYDGGNFEISGLTMGLKEDRQGLFGYASRATISNIILKNPQIKNAYGASPSGAIVGGGDLLTIRNCHVKGGSIQGDSNYIGGIIGGGIGNKLYDCTNSANVSGVSAVGGIAAWHTADSKVEIKNCINYGKIEADNVQVGGIVGILPNGEITDCFNYGTIKGAHQVGGIAGQFAGTLERCVVDCRLEETGIEERMIGGIVGCVGSDKVTTISNCAVEAYISTLLSETDYAGTLIGAGHDAKTNVTLSNCSFSGASTISTMNFYGKVKTENYTLKVENCYAVINQDKYYSSGDFAGFACEDGFNKSLPAQKALYWAIGVAPEFSVNWFTQNGFRRV